MNSNIRQVPNVGEFSYFRDDEGGMTEHLFDDATSLKEIIPAWMSADHREGDSVLVQWLDTALHGDAFNHRAGVVVCVARRYEAGPPLPIRPKSLRTKNVRRDV